MSPQRFKPYRAYKDSGVEWLGESPAFWDAVSVKRLGKIRYRLGQPTSRGSRWPAASACHKYL